ncbi:hypothetical protein OJ748_004562 [Salmonella enterica]|nr:hypothetical protein [Salmonella enterica]EAV0172876.1 hypothetical protein [Salmonella enterica]EBH7977778.1 hypothetical protein [Salmonella enterica]EBO0675828.1 hypothetical protein [Salmonella enterica]ECR9241297.1 hypothetical protein [Salmonella enterica]
MEREFSALASLNRNVNFWFEQCGLTRERVIRCVDTWYDFAYPPSEQEEAKRKVKEDLMKE